jgi:hypothetical protein
MKDGVSPCEGRRRPEKRRPAIRLIKGDTRFLFSGRRAWPDRQPEAAHEDAMPEARERREKQKLKAPEVWRESGAALREGPVKSRWYNRLKVGEGKVEHQTGF